VKLPGRRTQRSIQAANQEVQERFPDDSARSRVTLKQIGSNDDDGQGCRHLCGNDPGIKGGRETRPQQAKRQPVARVSATVSKEVPMLTRMPAGNTRRQRVLEGKVQ